MKASSLPKHIRQAAGITLDAGGRARPKLAAGQPGQQVRAA